MYSRFHYILIALIAVIIYLFYLIAYHKFHEYQADSSEQALRTANHEIEDRNKHKEAIEKYIHTPAYRTQIAKASQNKRLPGEELINVITQEDVESNVLQDMHDTFTDTPTARKDPTTQMTNPQKWRYLIEHGIRRY